MDRHITLFTTNPPFHLTYDMDETAEAGTAPRPVITNPALAHGDRFVCSQCGAAITSSALRIAVDGSHRHLVPSGFGPDQEIGCFSLAPGCAVIGHFAMDFAKPSQGQWRMGVCATCGAHLGWHHHADDGTGFFGLILDHLDVGDDATEQEDT